MPSPADRPLATTDQSGRLAAASPASAGSAADPLALPGITLPKGGGAIRGIDEKLTVSLSTGAASLSVPLPLTPSRQGFGPQLSLAYDSGTGNGPFGLGWQLNVASITRKTSMGLPRYEDAESSDVFVLSGAEDLVPLLLPMTDGWSLDANDDPTGEYLVTRYRPRAEGDFARIEQWRRTSTGDVHWRTVTRQNVTSLFGQDATSRIYDPADPTRIFTWLLDFSYDDRGNAMSFQYKAEDDTNVPSVAHEQGRVVTANRYLKQITYGNVSPYSPAGGSPPATWFFQAVLDYGEHDPTNPKPGDPGPWACRPDPFSRYRSCFEVRTYRLCQRVLMFHRFPDGTDTDATLVKSLDLAYTNGDPSDPALPAYSLLGSITERGYIPGTGGVPSPGSVPPLTLAYSPLAVDQTVSTASPDTLENLPAGADGRTWRWCDLDGEGLQGILSEDDGAWYYKRNISAYPDTPPVARFEPMTAVATKPTGNGSSRTPVLVNLHGDGRLCAVTYAPPEAGYFERDTEGDWRPFKPFASAALDWANPNVRSVDIDGDGLADVLLTEDDAFTWFPWLADDGFGDPQRVVTTRDEDLGPAVVLDEGDSAMFLADMSGDGLSDLVRIRNGEVVYWPNLGYGRFGTKVVMDGTPLFEPEDTFDGRRVRLSDVDGSGTADLVYLGTGGVSLWFNQSGNTFTAATVLSQLPATDDTTALAAMDLLGTGTGCLVWSSTLPGDAGRQLRYVELTGGVKPYLLISIVNNMGAESTLAYAASTRFYVEDLLAGRPWITRLAFPVQVVAQKQVVDRVSDTQLVTSYSYHHGYFDTVEREFRGFARVEETDTDYVPSASGSGTFTSVPTTAQDEFVLPAVLTKTWLDTGAYVGGNGIAAALATEYFSGDAAAAHLADTLFVDDATPEEMREACRALRGRTLHTEIYALDGTTLAFNPYTVSEYRYQVSLLQPPMGTSYGSVYACELEVLSYGYEREPADPRVSHDLVLERDSYGAVTKAAKVAYPRRSPAFTEQGATLVTYTENDVTNVDTEFDWYRIGLPVETRVYQLTGLPVPAGLYDTTSLLTEATTATEVPYEVQADGTALQKRMFARTRTIYRANDLSGPLPLSQVQYLALVDCVYSLGLTAGLVALTYSAKTTAASASATLTGPGGLVDLDGDGNLWRPTSRVFYSPATPGDPPVAPAPDPVYAAQHFYLPQGDVDAWGGVSTITWEHDLAVVGTSDAVGNTTTAQVNYRVVQPWLVTDTNNDRTGTRFDQLGLVTATAVMGKLLTGGTDEGDHLDVTTDEASSSDDPTTTFDYDLTAYSDWAEDPTHDPAHPTPVWAHRRTRVLHKDPSTQWLESYVYTDGGGRAVLTKEQAEPGSAPVRDSTGNVVRDQSGAPQLAETDSRWVGTGRIVYDNKANPVKEYEPFFDSTSAYADESDLVNWGVTSITRYDPLSRPMRVDNPDGTFRSVEFDPWRQLAFDEDDNVLQSKWYTTNVAAPAGSDAHDAATKAAAMADTPDVSDLDPLGRTFHTVADGVGGQLETTLTLDIQGHQLVTTDALGRATLTSVFDLAGNAVQTTSIDAGGRWLLTDASGQPILQWDSRDFAVRRTYDARRRPLGVYVTAGTGPELMAESTVYGEGRTNDAGDNLRGTIYEKYDSAGVATSAVRDFEGNVLTSSRQVLSDLVNDVDWSSSTPPALDPTTLLATTSTFDALKRVLTTTAPDGSVTTRTYNERSLLATVGVALHGGTPQPVVTSVAYDAKKQRTSIVYGNGVSTSYTYDPETFRLVELTTSRPGDPGPLQDLAYAYDPVGNVTRLSDSAQQTIFFSNQVVTPSADYTYDAVYRLVRATGREHASKAVPVPTTWTDSSQVAVPLPSDAQAMVNYTETYAYDTVGNFSTVSHSATSGSWTRTYAYDEPVLPPGNNRLTSATVGSAADHFTYDPNGNLASMPHLSLMAWDWSNRLKATASQVVGNGTPETSYYRYDSMGQRVVKATNSATGAVVAERIYLGCYEMYREFDTGGNVTLQTDSLHVSDGARRVCLFETTTGSGATTSSAGPAPGTLTRYQLGNHVDSALLELDEVAAIITYEEYYPFGSTSFQSGRSQSEVSLKRYRFTGRERDAENGFYYEGARYYAPWLGRWTSCDPKGLVDGPNVYTYAKNNPVIVTDPTGTSSGVDELPSPALDILKRLGSSDDGGESGGSSSVPIFDFLKALWGGITSLASAVWQGIKGIATTIWSSLKSVGRAVASWFKSPHPSFVQGLRSLAGALGGLVLAVVLAPIFVILGGLIHSVYTLFAGDRASTSATSRPLSKPERDLLHEYFGDSIDYDAVTVARDGLAAVGAPRTVANTISLKSSWGQFVGDGLDLSDYGRRTLVHEMTHVWQYQHYGSAYMAESLANQFDAWVSKGDRDAAYEWTGLVDSGVPFEQWNPEQQAMAVEDYYALQNGLDFRINGTPVTDPAQRESWKAKLAPIVSKLKGP